MFELTPQEMMTGNHTCVSKVKKRKLNLVDAQIVVNDNYVQFAIHICDLLGRSRVGQATLENIVDALKNNNKKPVEKIKYICKNIMNFRYEKNYQDILGKVCL